MVPKRLKTDDAESAWRKDETPLRRVIEELNGYFAGRLQRILPLAAPEGTVFQKRVWSELQRIPYGETISYGQLAERIGNPKASRAVVWPTERIQFRSSCRVIA